MEENKINYKIAIPTILIIAGIFIVMAFCPKEAKWIIQTIFDITVKKFGWVYLLVCILSFGMLFYVTFSGNGNIKLGEENEKPKYSNFSWAAMLFTSGVGSSAVILGFMEPLYYLETPPFGIKEYSIEAYEYAHMLGQFHWGPSAWAFYVPAIVAVAIVVYKGKKDMLRLSVVTSFFHQSKISRIMGTAIDIVVMIGILTGISTSFGLAVPVVSRLISDVFLIPNNLVLKIGILAIWIALFTFSVYRGLDKGIKLLSNINIFLLLVFAGLLILMGPATDICKMEINSVGLYASEFLRINTWTDPFGTGRFQELWTIFYWGWWLTYMPLMALFIVRISRGRTLKNVIWNQLIWGTLGCWFCFGIFGGYSLYMQKNGVLDLNTILKEGGQDQALMSLLNHLPMSKLMILLFCILIFIFLATTIDSAAYILASNSEKRISIDEQPKCSHRILWALVLAVLSVGLLILGELKAIQTLSIIGSIPLIPVQIYMCISGCRLLKQYGKGRTFPS